MKTILRISFLSLLFFALSCSKDDNEVPEVAKSDAKAITSFVFNANDNAALSENISTTVAEASKTASASVPNGTDVTALTPNIQVSAKASVSPSGPQDFSSPVTYTVTAEDGSTARYIASITVLEIENSAPLDFDLIAVTDNAVEVDVLPTFSWNATTDPDGDTVTYDLYVDTGATADQLYAENLTDTTFELTDPLSLLEEYTWRVVAKDPMGLSVSSNTQRFSTRSIKFNQVTNFDSSLPFFARQGHTSVVFDTKFWMIGGSDGDAQNDAWFSGNGTAWSAATREANFSKRFGHTSVVFDNKIWVIGGKGGNSEISKSDVWFSEDGITWQEAVSEAPFGVRLNHTSVVFDNKIWVIGGEDENSLSKNDVWFSADGVTWSSATDAAPFTGRSRHTTTVFDNKIWVIGGFNNDEGSDNEVWYSEDGIVWSETTSPVPFSARVEHASVVFDDKLWLIGGIDNSGRKNDVWFSEDGDTWQEITNVGAFLGVSSHTSLVFDNKVWIIFGGRNSDIWTFD